MAYAVVNKTGCGIRKGNCQIRLDFFLEATDPRYTDKYLYLVDTTSEKYLAGYQGEVDETGNPVDLGDYEDWLDSLPHVWKNTPFHTHFIYLPATFTDKDIEDAIALHLPNFYKAFVVDRWDEVAGGMRHGWDITTRKRPTDYSKTDTQAEYDARSAACQVAIDAYEPSQITPESDRGGTFPATEIDVGMPAIDRDNKFSSSYTLITLDNPANDTGTLDTFEIYAKTSMTGTNKVGTFYGSTSLWTNRDWQSIGSVTAGSAQQFTGLSIDVETSDCAGIYFSVGEIEMTYFGEAGVKYKSGDQFGQGEQSYLEQSGACLSLYGTGETPTEQTKYPQSASTLSVEPEDDNDWGDPTNIYADDAAYALIDAPTYDTDDISYRLRAYNFGFSIPEDATIVGIKVEMENYCDAGGAVDYRVQLVDGDGNLAGDNKADTVTAWDGTPTVHTYGGETDTWNASLDRADVNDTDFGVILSVEATAKNTDIFVDFIRITVYYEISAEKLLAGVSTCVSTVGAPIKVSRKIASVSNGVSTVTGFAKVTKKIAGIANGISTTAGSLSKAIQLAGSSAGVATVAGAIKIGRKIAGLSTGLSTVAGSIKVTRLLSGVSNAVSTVTGSIKKVYCVTKYPSSATGQYEPPEDDVQWTNTYRIYADDDEYCYISQDEFDTNAISYRLWTGGYNFNIPKGANILGVKVEIERACTPGQARDYRIQLSDDEQDLLGNNKADTENNWESSPTIKEYGSETDTWGASLTPALVNSHYFGVHITAKAYANDTDVWIDFARITVCYEILWLSLAGVSAGVSTVVGALGIGKLLAGISNGLSTVAGNLVRIRGLVGISNALSTVSGTIKRTRELIGSSAGLSTVAGAIKRSRGLQAISNGLSTVTGTLQVGGEVLIAGISAGVSTVAGFLKVTKEFIGSSAGVSTSSAFIKVTKKLQAISNGVSTAIGTLTKGGEVLLQAVSTGVSTVSGALKATKKLIGSSSGVSTVTGALKRIKSLVASTAGISTVVGFIKVTRKLAGVSTGISTAIATLSKYAAGLLIKLKMFFQTYHDVKLFTQTYHDVVVFTETYHDVRIWTGESNMIRRDWQRGETVPIWAEVKLVSTGALYDPESVLLTMTCKETSTVVLNAVAMTKDSEGMYVYYWNTDSDNVISWYKCDGKAQDGSGAGAKVTIEHGGFNLRE